MAPNYTLAHSGIKGMHWGFRRFQNKDGSLTTEGRLRYRAEKRAEKERRRRDKILSNPKLLRKRYAEFTAEELEGARQKIETQHKINQLKRDEDLAKLNAKVEQWKKPLAAKAEVATAQANKQLAELNAKAQKVKNKQDKEAGERKAEKDKISTQLDIKNKKSKSSADQWKNYNTKLENILGTSEKGKKVTDQLGITDDKLGSTLLETLGIAFGLKKIPAPKP